MTRAYYNLLVAVWALVRLLPRVDLAVSVERARVRQHLAAVLALNTRLPIGTNLSRPGKYLFKKKYLESLSSVRLECDRGPGNFK